MDGLENNQNQNTAGAAGTNTNIDPAILAAINTKFNELMTEKAPKQAEKATEKLATNILNSFDGLNDELKAKLYSDHLEGQRKAKQKEIDRIAKMEKDLEDATNKLKAYETEKLQATIKANSINVFSKMEITNPRDINLIQDLAGDKLYACVKEDGSFDEDKAKTLFEDITKKYEIGVSKEPDQNLQIGTKKQEATEINNSQPVKKWNRVNYS